MSASDSTTRSTPLRAIIWCAVSSEEQAKNDKTSLETQQRDARQFAEENKMQIVDVLIVGGFSRRFYNYPEFVEAAAADEFYDPAKMLEHWKRRDFDVLIARDASRLGREQGILGEFVARTVHGGARLYMKNGGWIAADNYREYISMSGYSAAKEVDRLSQGARETKLKNVAEKGLMGSGRPPISHKWVRNEAGKLLRLELDESKRRLWNDLETVFLEGVGYTNIEKTLYERFGHTDERTGKPYKQRFFYHLLHNPFFWGNSAYGYKSVTIKNGQKVGAWVYDPSCPAPEGTQIFYGVNDPVYTGDQAVRVKDELRRRAMAIQGTARPHRTHKFSGLLLCGYCGHYMVYESKSRAYRCQSKYQARNEQKCDRYRQMSEKKIQAWVHARLVEMLKYDMPDLLARGDDKPDLNMRIDSLKNEINVIEGQARALVIKQAHAHSALMSIYDDEIQAIGERIDILKNTLAQAERELQAQDTSAAKAAFHDLPENLADFWTWEGTTINQLLHRLVGRRRLVIRDSEIVSTQDAPAHPAKKDRKRTYFGKNRKSPTG
ncbi:MAG: hypothetical protein GC204_11265 [Chloroflexi bacterium]|nr:hypothetical protein [Chloroflexota bacterium]